MVVATEETRVVVRQWLAVGTILALLLFAFPLVIHFPLLDPAEGLHASIAQEMVERGDWITPRLHGEPFLDKPILFFWVQAASLRVFGMNELAVRLPGLMFGLLGVVTTGLVAWKMFDRLSGALAAMFYATLILPTAMAQAAAHDVALIPWINLSVLLFWKAETAPSRRDAARATLAVGVILGLACLTKGLVGVAIVGIAYGSYLVVTRRLSLTVCLRGAVALGVATLVASPWYFAMELRNPGYLYYYFVDRHVLGFASDTQLHAGQPWWYYLPIILGGGMPWVVYLPVVAQDAWSRWRSGFSEREDDHGAAALVWCWLLSCAILFSVAQSKTVAYILPVFPAVAILAALGWTRFLGGVLCESARRALARTFWLSCPFAPVLLPVAILVVQAKLHIQFSPLAWLVFVLAGSTSWVPCILWWAGRMVPLLEAATLAMATQFVVIMAFVLPQVAPLYSAPELAAALNRRGNIPSRVILGEERIGSLVFYLDPKLRAGLKPGQLRTATFNSLAKHSRSPGDAILVVPQNRVDRARPFFVVDTSPFEQAGRHRLYPMNQLVRRAPSPPTPLPHAGEGRKKLGLTP